MIKLGILGHPLTHTLSPFMHHAALNALGLTGSYQVFDTLPDDVEYLLLKLQQEQYCGLNITIPYKVTILKFVDHMSPIVQKIGSANTLLFKDNQIYGDNTDVYGFIQGLTLSQQELLKDKKAIILGCGGATRAVVFGLVSLGIKSIDIYVRSYEKAKVVLDTFQRLYPTVIFTLHLIQDISLKPSISILVNCTPIGMYPHSHETPLDPATLEFASEDLIVYDLIYKPRETTLCKMSGKRGLTTINGVDMLVHQGAKSLALWLEYDRIPYSDMKKTLLHHLDL